MTSSEAGAGTSRTAGTRLYDVVVVGAGTAGCYAAATVANEGYDVVVVERKSEQEAGHIACGDALKGADQFPESIPKSKLEPAMTNTEVDHGRFEIPQEDTVLEIPVPGKLAVIDRWEYGRAIIDGASEAGAEFRYDTVVQDVVQDADERSSSSPDSQARQDAVEQSSTSPHSTSSHEDAAGTSSGEPSLADAREDADERSSSSPASQTRQDAVEQSSSSPASQTRQDDDAGRVTGVRAKRKGETLTYEADVVIDAAGALSLLQDKADLDDATFDTNVDYSQFCSAYREIVHVEEPVEWDDALVFKPTERAAGYLWYFPRTDTEINAGLGFQMTEEPMQLVDDLKQDLRNREEFDGAEVSDKLGAALPTRRPYDSAVAPGFMAVGDAAGHVNPTTGGGIAGAAYAGKYAAEAAVDAIEDGDVSEANLWEYNERVMDHFGSRYAGLDVYNILSTAVDVDDLMGLLAALPGDKLAEALYSGSTSIGWKLKLQTALKSLGYYDVIWTFYKTKQCADDIIDHYENYPDDPDAFDAWQARRDDLMEDVYATTGADPKY